MHVDLNMSVYLLFLFIRVYNSLSLCCNIIFSI